MLALQNPSRSRSVPAARTLRRWAQSALRHPAEITVRVVGNPEGLRLNRAWRGQAHPTNVLSFAYGRAGGVIRGDLVLCAPVLARQAREQGKSVSAHYAHMVVHGLLHLQGYDHQDDAQAARMERRERLILRQLGYADPYAAPVPGTARR